MYDEAPFAIGGLVAGLICIALVGYWLFSIRSRFRDALAPYVGEEPVRWLYGFAWVGYAVGALQAVSSALGLAPDWFVVNRPSGVQFVVGVLNGPILTFTSYLTQFLQIGAVLAAVFIVARVLRAEAP